MTGFFLVAAFPTRPIVTVLGVALTASGLGLWVTGRSPRVVPVVAALVGLGSLLFVFDGPCDYETTYHCAIVDVDRARPGGRTLVLDRVRNSYVDLDDPAYLEFRYIRLFADIINAESPPGPLHVVSIGGGGFTMPGYLNATRPGTTNVVLEIDGPLVDIGTNELALTDEVEVVIEDARISLQDLPDNRADVVIGDAFSGASVPWHLTTVEFSREIRRVLTRDGVYTMNVIDYGSRRFARAAAATLEEVFDHVALFAPRTYIDGPNGGNYILVASESPIDLVAVERVIQSRGGVEQGIGGKALDDFIDGAKPLTDDFAPVDQIVGRPF